MSTEFTPSIYLVPDWIEQAVVRHGFDLLDLLDPKKIDLMLSKEDYFDLMELNNLRHPILKIASWHLDVPCEFDRSSLGTAYQSIHTGETSHGQAVLTRLTETNQLASPNQPITETTNFANQPYYTITHRTGRVIFIVLRPGFVNRLLDRAFVRLFLSDVLKVCYQLMPVHHVSTLSVFRMWLNYL